MRWTKFFPDGKGGFEAFDWGLEYDFFQVAIKLVQTMIICLLFPFFIIPVCLIFSPTSPTREDRLAVPIACILLSIYMLIDFNKGWFFCYLYRDNFPDFYIYSMLGLAYSVIWFVIYIVIEQYIDEWNKAQFNSWEVSPYGMVDLLVIWVLIFFLFFYVFEPMFYDSFVEMRPTTLSPYYENLRQQIVN
mgnify:CR=1 FL=1